MYRMRIGVVYHAVQMCIGCFMCALLVADLVLCVLFIGFHKVYECCWFVIVCVFVV